MIATPTMAWTRRGSSRWGQTRLRSMGATRREAVARRDVPPRDGRRINQLRPAVSLCPQHAQRGTRGRFLLLAQCCRGDCCQPFQYQRIVHPFIYSGNRTSKPTASGMEFQIDGTPFGKGNSPFGSAFQHARWCAVHVISEVQRRQVESKYDESGRNASENNTFRLFTWIAF